jgi:hypothetical protein
MIAQEKLIFYNYDLPEELSFVKNIKLIDFVEPLPSAIALQFGVLPLITGSMHFY